MSRDAASAIVAYNAPVRARHVARAHGAGDLTAEALRRKLDALAADPFRFFRGTFHLMAADFAAAGGPRGLIVGDIHLENFGVYRGSSGEVCFDVNDFDDVGLGPVELDVTRLCTSALLLPSVAPNARLVAAVAAAHGWAAELLRLSARFPVPPWSESKADGLVRALLRGKQRRTRDDLLARNCNEQHDALAEIDGKLAHVEAAWAKRARDAAASYFASLRALKAQDVPEEPEVLDVAYRFKGTGSLGRLRFTVLVRDGKTLRVFELKEARASVLSGPDEANRALVQVAVIRRLQGDPWPRVGAGALGDVPVLGRELEPEEEKLDRDKFAKDPHQLESYAQQCGQVLARLHARANASTLLAAGYDADAAAKRCLEAAERYAPRVEEDFRSFVRKKDEVARALALEDSAA